jgi:hypothetical protein
MGTYKWALEKGFDRAQANRIANANIRVDNIFLGKSFLPVLGKQGHHFNTDKDALAGTSGDSRIVAAKDYLRRAIEMKNQALEMDDGREKARLLARSEKLLGQAGHPLIDLVFHTENRVGKTLIGKILKFLGILSHSQLDHTDSNTRTASVAGAKWLIDHTFDMYNKGELDETHEIWNPRHYYPDWNKLNNQ